MLNQLHLEVPENQIGGSNNANRVGARTNERAPGVAGVRTSASRASNEAALVACVTQVADNFFAMSDACIGRSSNRIEEAVREEVQKAVDELKTLLASRDTTREE